MAGGAGLMPPASPQPVQEASENTPLQALMKTPEWQAERAAWYALDSLAPEEGGFYGCPRDIGADERDSLREMIADRLGDLDRAADAAGIRPPELSAFRALLLRRVEFLSGGDMRLITRMVPPAVVLDASSAIQQMELRIDTLTTLRRSGGIGLETWKQGAAAAADAAVASVILEVLAAPRCFVWSGSFDYPPYRGRSVDTWALVKMRMSEAGEILSDTLLDKDTRTLLSEALASADSMLSIVPGLEMMLTDLIGGVRR